MAAQAAVKNLALTKLVFEDQGIAILPALSLPCSSEDRLKSSLFEESRYHQGVAGGISQPNVESLNLCFDRYEPMP